MAAWENRPGPAARGCEIPSGDAYRGLRTFCNAWCSDHAVVPVTSIPAPVRSAFPLLFLRGRHITVVMPRTLIFFGKRAPSNTTVLVLDGDLALPLARVSCNAQRKTSANGKQVLSTLPRTRSRDQRSWHARRMSVSPTDPCLPAALILSRLETRVSAVYDVCRHRTQTPAVGVPLPATICNAHVSDQHSLCFPAWSSAAPGGAVLVTSRSRCQAMHATDAARSVAPCVMQRAGVYRQARADSSRLAICGASGRLEGSSTMTIRLPMVGGLTWARCLGLWSSGLGTAEAKRLYFEDKHGRPRGLIPAGLSSGDE